MLHGVRGPFAAVAQSSATAAVPPAISTITGVRRLSQEQARANPAAELRGIVTWLDTASSGFVLADESAAIWVYGPVPERLAVGSRVQVLGRAIEGYFTVTLRADQVSLLGTGPLPAPVDALAREQLQGKWDNFRMAVTGTLFHRPNLNGQPGLLLLSDGVPIWLTGPGQMPAFPSGLVTAEVTGISSLGVRERQILDCGLLLDSWSQLKLVRTNLEAPAAVTVRGLLNGTNGAWLDRRVELEGVITWKTASRFVLQDAGQGILVHLTNRIATPPGHRVRVTGAAERTPQRLEFLAAAVRDLGTNPLPAAVTPEATASLADPDLFGRKVRVPGRLVYRRTEGLRDDWVLVRAGGTETFRFERESGPNDRLASIPVDSTVEALGVLLPLAGGEDRPAEAELFLESSDSVWLQEGPPLPRSVTFTFAAVAAGSLLVSLLGAAWWLHSRRVQGLHQRQLESENRLQRRFALIAETASDQILTLNLRGHITFINPVGHRLLAHPGDSLLGQPYARWIAPEHRAPWMAAMAAVAAGEDVRPFDIELERMDRSRVEIEVVLRRLSEEELHCIGRDLTEARQAQRELARQELQLRTIVDSMAEGILVMDARGVMLSVNPAAETILGIRRQEVVGRRMRTDWECRDADGLPVPPERYPIFRTLKTGISVDAFELSLQHPSGRRSWLAINSRVLVRGTTGEIEQVIATFTDITARREAEQQRQQLEEQLRRSESLRALGTLAGGVAHDFNNLLASMLGNADLSLAMLPADHPAAENSREIAAAAKRGAELVRRILSFSRPHSTGQHPVLLSAVVEEAARVVTRTLPPTVQLHWQAEPDEQPVMGDRTQLHQAIVNLCTNAAHAMETSGGRVEVTLGSVTSPAEQVPAGTGIPAGPTMRLRVRDTGCGMDAETIARIFEPFFTTKGPGRGTGLGMAIVNSVVQAHGGHITVESAPGRGTTVEVLLPALVARVVRELPPMEEAPLTPVGGGQRVLVVDDDSAVLRLTATALGRAGFRVTALGNPTEAWGRFSADPAAFDVLVTDLSMPEQSGVDLALAIRAVRPDLPVIIVTGYGPTAEQLLAKAEGKFPVLPKPFAVAELVKRVQAEHAKIAAGPEI